MVAFCADGFNDQDSCGTVQIWRDRSENVRNAVETAIDVDFQKTTYLHRFFVAQKRSGCAS